MAGIKPNKPSQYTIMEYKSWLIKNEERLGQDWVSYQFKRLERGEYGSLGGFNR